MRVTFDYNANYDNSWFNLAMDTSATQGAWADNVYGPTNGRVNISWPQAQAPTWVAFDLLQVGGPGSRISIASWFGQITNLTLYYTTDHSVTVTQSGSPSSNEVRTDYYDGLGRIFESKTPDENGQYVTSFKSYDANGRLAQEAVPIEFDVLARGAA